MKLSEEMTFTHEEPLDDVLQRPDLSTPEPLIAAADSVDVLSGEAAGTIMADPATTLSFVQKVRAESFLEGLEAGNSPTRAAQMAGTTLQEIQNDPATMELVTGLVKQFSLDSVTRKKVLRAKLNQVLLQGNDKDALTAAKQIADDPEMGMNSRVPQVAVQMNFDARTKAVLDTVGDVEGL